MKHPRIISITLGLALAGLISTTGADTSLGTKADQACLKRLAFYTGSVDGRWGQQSQAALEAWARGSYEKDQAEKLTQLRRQCAPVPTSAPQKTVTQESPQVATPTYHPMTMQAVANMKPIPPPASGSAWGGVIILALIACYFVPAIVASMRSHHQTTAIAALNILLGWTALGWIISLVWACTATPVALASAVPSTRGDT